MQTDRQTDKQANKQTNRHTDTLIEILRTVIGGKVITLKVNLLGTTGPYILNIFIRH